MERLTRPRAGVKNARPGRRGERSPPADKPKPDFTISGNEKSDSPLELPEGGLAETHARITLTQRLAQGGLGSIWLARDHDLNREIVIKELIDHQALGPDRRQRFLREAQITAQLEHPNIVPVFGLGYRTGSDAPFLMMRYVRGRTFYEAISDYHGDGTTAGRYEKAQLRPLLRAFICVCRALDFAHRRGVVHADPKPANVILGDTPEETILLDWGLAKTISAAAAASLSDGSQLMGTPAYMAPEQGRGADSVGIHTDIFVLGGSLFHLLTNRTPWEARGFRSVSEILGQLKSSSPPRPREVIPAVPAALDAICAKALAYAPEDRYPSAAALADDVERWLSGDAVSVYPESGLRRLARSLFARA